MLGPFVDPKEEPSTRREISTIGLDIAKRGLAVHGFDAEGNAYGH
jgi:hypothetical protein